jgi:hypothetical protein
MRPSVQSLDQGSAARSRERAATAMGLSVPKDPSGVGCEPCPRRRRTAYSPKCPEGEFSEVASYARFRKFATHKQRASRTCKAGRCQGYPPNGCFHRGRGGGSARCCCRASQMPKPTSTIPIKRGYRGLSANQRLSLPTFFGASRAAAPPTMVHVARNRIKRLVHLPGIACTPRPGSGHLASLLP